MSTVMVPPSKGAVTAAAWSTPEWRASAVAWLDGRLAASGLVRISDVKQTRIRPWSTILKAETTGGVVWFKASGNGTAFEPALYDLLQRVTPEFVLAPLGVDVDRGWLLLPDGGPALGSIEDDDAFVDALTVIFPQYAELQLRLSTHTGALLRAGVADMRPAVLPDRFEEALEYVDASITRRGTAEDRARHDQLLAMSPRVKEWIERLAVAPGQPTLDHNDLHAHNVFVNRSARSLQPRFYDWGDTVVAHPFTSMLVGLGFLTGTMKMSRDDRRVLRVRDAYLEPFGALASRDELLSTLDVAVRVAAIARCLVWARAVKDAADDDPNAHHSGPMLSLFALLSDAYLANTP